MSLESAGLGYGTPAGHIFKICLFSSRNKPKIHKRVGKNKTDQRP